MLFNTAQVMQDRSTANAVALRLLWGYRFAVVIVINCENRFHVIVECCSLELFIKRIHLILLGMCYFALDKSAMRRRLEMFVHSRSST